MSQPNHYPGFQELQQYIVENAAPNLSEFVKRNMQQMGQWTGVVNDWSAIAATWERRFSDLVRLLRPDVKPALECPKVLWEKVDTLAKTREAHTIESLNAMKALVPENVQMLTSDTGEGSSNARSKVTEDIDVSSSSAGEHPRRTTTYAYSDLEYCQNVADEAKWLEDGDDISEELFSFRNCSIDTCKKSKKSLSPRRVLSLHHVYLFAVGPQKSVFHQELPSLKRQSCKVRLPVVVSSWCKTILDLLQDHPEDTWMLKKELLAFQNEVISTKDHNKMIAAEILHDIAADCGNRLLQPGEDTFVHRYVRPFIHHIFCQDRRLTHKWANAVLAAAVANRAKGIHSPKFLPDFTASVPDNGRLYDVLVIKVKKPGVVVDEVVKVGQEMKLMIDELIKKKFSGTVVAGIVISGSECRTYKMDIPASGIYRLVELQRFDLITRKTQIALLPQVVEGFLQIKGIIAPTVTAIEARMNSRNTQSAKTSHRIGAEHR